MELPAWPSPYTSLPKDLGQAMTPSRANIHPNPRSEPARGAPGGSRQTTISPDSPGNGEAFEGKVHFVNQPIVGLPSAGSSSPGVSLGAVDTDVNCQGCPPPSTSLLGHPAGPAQGPLSQRSPLAPCENQDCHTFGIAKT